MYDDEFGLEDWQKMFVRSWRAGHALVGRDLSADIQDDYDDEPNPYHGTYSEE